MTLARRATVALLAIAVACSSDPAPPVVEAPPPFPDDPAQAALVTSDVEHFWAAFDAGPSAANLDRLYLSQASPGLRDFERLRAVTADAVAANVAAHPRYFRAIRERSMSVAASGVGDAIRANHARMKALYPAAVFPPVTLVVGRFSTAGTTSANGILVGAEFFGRDAATPLDELSQFERDNVHPLDELPIVVEHELVHVLQGRAGGVLAHAPRTLLDRALLEGSADFVGELASGGNLNAHLFAYGLANEPALWREFQAEMHGLDTSGWLYNQGSADGAVPGDLGYFIGYRIAQAYYARATDKAAAVARIVEVDDADGLLRDSGYAP